MIVIECIARGRALTFLLSDDACQYSVLSKYVPVLCSGRMFHRSWYRYQIVMSNIFGFVSVFFFLHVLQSLCKFVKCCHQLAHVSHCSLTTSVAFCNYW